MKKLIVRSSLLLAAAGMFAVTGCEKIVDDATETTESAESAASDMLVLSTATDGFQDIVEYDPNLQMKNGSLIIPRENLSYVGGDSSFSDNNGVTIQFDFEPNTTEKYTDIKAEPAAGSGTLCGDGTRRWGSGTISISAPVDQDGSVATMKLNSFIVLKDGRYYKIDKGNGSDIELVLKRTSGRWELSYDLSFESRGASETETSGVSFGNGTFYIANTDGGQPGLVDDQITVTGSSKNINTSGTKYDLSIPADAPLFRKGDPTCSNTFISGRIELKNEGSNFTIKADFGSGNCDNDVEVTLPAGVKKTISVK